MLKDYRVTVTAIIKVANEDILNDLHLVRIVEDTLGVEQTIIVNRDEKDEDYFVVEEYTGEFSDEWLSKKLLDVSKYDE